MRRVEHIMGTAVSLDIPGCDNADIFNDVFVRLREIDGRFSPYKADSEVSRFREGQLKKQSKEFKSVVAACEGWQTKTGGYFSAFYGGRYDPSGYVKGWAIAEAGRLINKAGLKTYCLGIGGDILARSDGGKKWRIGIQSPFDKSGLLKTLELENGAVATSGAYERGAHIINPKTKKPADFWAGVTVTGPDITEADVLATACFAMGEKALELASKSTGCSFLFIDKNGHQCIVGEF